MSRRWWWLPGALAGTLLLAVAGGPLLALLQHAPLAAGALWQDPYLQRVVWFSLEQALLSTLLSLALALPVARALHRRRFPGRGLLLQLFGLSQVLPVIIALFGLVAVHGHGGWVPRSAAALGLGLPTYLFGLPGILLAHVFFNMPLAARWSLQALEQIPEQNWRLASQLGLRNHQLFRLLEWPLLRPQLPALASLIFMLCFTSFTTIMALGGGPRSTTLEVAIYQALRFDFDLGTAGRLALWQLLLSGGVLLLHPRRAETSPGLPPGPVRWLRPDRRETSARVEDACSLALALGLFVPPLLAILASGLNPGLLPSLQAPLLWQTTFTSLGISLTAAGLALGLTLALLLTSRHLRLRRERLLAAGVLESLGSVILLLPTLVLGTGLFILLRPVADVFGLGFYLVVVLNALAALPYTLRTLSQPMQLVARQYDRLADSLGLQGWARWRWLEWPLLRRPLGRAFGLAMIFSLGDLGAVAMFGSEELKTLPWLLFQQLGSYRLREAAATALLLLLLCLALLWLTERGIGGKDAATG